LKIKIISIGNNPPKWAQDIFLEYTSRLKGHFKIELIEIKSDKNIKSIKQKKFLDKYTKLISDKSFQQLFKYPNNNAK
jgi:23S rRNA pseudoU1915 N3-methylase RlmH